MITFMVHPVYRDNIYIYFMGGLPRHDEAEFICYDKFDFKFTINEFDFKSDF